VLGNGGEQAVLASNLLVWLLSVPVPPLSVPVRSTGDPYEATKDKV